MSFKNVARALVTTAALAAAGAATAATFTFQFTGTVTYGAGLSVPVGAPISGSYSYDAKTEPADHSKGYSYYQIPSPHIISATVAGHTITTERLLVTVVNNFKGSILQLSGPLHRPGCGQGLLRRHGRVRVQSA